MVTTRSATWTAVLALAVALATGSAAAQETTVSVGAGASSFDLSGTGTAAAVALRVDRAVHPRLRVEGGLTVVRPEQQFGATTTLLAPEAQLQWAPVRLSWFAERWWAEPYLGVGAGVAHDLRPERDDETDVSFSGALGIRIPVGSTGTRGLEAELRARFLESGFTGSTGDFTLGWYWSP